MAITAKDLKDLVRIVFLCIFWYVVGSSNGVLGKWILSEFPFPVTLTMVKVSIVCPSQNISYIGLAKLAVITTEAFAIKVVWQCFFE